jgi:hypothetical protein
MNLQIASTQQRIVVRSGLSLLANWELHLEQSMSFAPGEESFAFLAAGTTTSRGSREHCEVARRNVADPGSTSCGSRLRRL